MHGLFFWNALLISAIVLVRNSFCVDVHDAVLWEAIQYEVSQHVELFLLLGVAGSTAKPGG